MTAASRYGATQEIAEAVSTVLRDGGHDVTVAPLEQAGTPAGYDAVVLGSAIYMGQWLKAARAYVSEHASELRSRPVWVFSSGPIGDPPTPDPEALDVSSITEAIHPAGHRVFGGRLDKAALRFRDRAVVSALRAPDADNRPWADIEAWAREIARSLAGDTG